MYSTTGICFLIRILFFIAFPFAPFFLPELCAAPKPHIVNISLFLPTWNVDFPLLSLSLSLSPPLSVFHHLPLSLSVSLSTQVRPSSTHQVLAFKLVRLQFISVLNISCTSVVVGVNLLGTVKAIFVSYWNLFAFYVCVSVDCLPVQLNKYEHCFSFLACLYCPSMFLLVPITTYEPFDRYSRNLVLSSCHWWRSQCVISGILKSAVKD